MSKWRFAGLIGSVLLIQVCVLWAVRPPVPPVTTVVPDGWLEAEETEIRRMDPRYPCGVTCLSTAARLLGMDIPLEESRRRLNPGVDGAVSLASLSSAIQQSGLCSIPARVSPSLIPVGTVCVAFVRGGHFVVLRKTSLSNWQVSDLPYPTFQITEDRLEALWDGTGAFIGRLPEDLAFLK